jgi:hypothetical protein
LDGRHVLGCIEKTLELRDGHAPICSRYAAASLRAASSAASAMRSCS